MSEWGESAGRQRFRASSLALLTVLLLMPSASLSRPASGAIASQYSSSGSWALGLVVPQGAPLSGGSKVSWGSVSNVTVGLQLPEIQHTDATIYAILSVMTSDGSILQLASGLEPNATSWRTYGMWIRNPTEYPQEYRTVLDNSSPALAPGAWISLSMYVENGFWNYRARGSGPSDSIHSVLNESLSPTPMSGDQEVFALESYTSTGSVFAGMRNLTVSSVLIDGDEVQGGTYFYGGGWNPSHTPLFIVGGEPPPIFVTAQSCTGNYACWSYVSPWSGNQGPLVSPDLTLVILCVIVLVPIATASIAVLTYRRRRG